MAGVCEFLTVAGPGKAIFKEKMSKFIAFARPVSTAVEAKAVVAAIANEYHDARHVCWAYMIGADRLEWLSSDNGEPSGTAGKPILGQINSAGLTDVVVAVVRYFGGIKLGTSGLIAAYREAARLALADAGTRADVVRATVAFTFPYIAMNDVMKVVKHPEVKVVEQAFDNSCRMVLSMRSDIVGEITGKLGGVDGVTF